jgi:hypothetical protein
MATVKIDGSEMELPDEICKTDKSLKDALTPFYPGAANSDVKRETKDGHTVITVTKRAGSKGGFESVFDALDRAPEWIHPALRYDVAGWRKGDGARVEEAMLDALTAVPRVGRIVRVLDAATPQASLTVPEGF